MMETWTLSFFLTVTAAFFGGACVVRIHPPPRAHIGWFMWSPAAGSHRAWLSGWRHLHPLSGHPCLQGPQAGGFGSRFPLPAPRGNQSIHEKKMKLLVARSCLTLCDPRTIVHQAPLSMRFSKQEYWSGLSFPSSQPRDWTWVFCIAGRFFAV